MSEANTEYAKRVISLISAECTLHSEDLLTKKLASDINRTILKLLDEADLTGKYSGSNGDKKTARFVAEELAKTAANFENPK